LDQCQGEARRLFKQWNQWLSTVAAKAQKLLRRIGRNLKKKFIREFREKRPLYR